MPSPIEQAALDAAAAAEAATLADRRQKVGALLEGKVDPATLTVPHSDGNLSVFTDGTVQLAVKVDGGVHLVTGSAPTFTDVAGPLLDLAELGTKLGG